MFAHARSDDVVVDASDVSFRLTQFSINGSCVSEHGDVDCGLPLQPPFLGMRLLQDHLQDCGGESKSRARDLPPHPWLQLPRHPDTVPSVYACITSAMDGTEGYTPREFIIGSSESGRAESSRQRRRRRTIRSARDVAACAVTRTAIGQHNVVRPRLSRRWKFGQDEPAVSASPRPAKGA
jgi:hypothetical protein